MQLLSNEEYLELEEFWKHRYDIKFKKVNENGTEWWEVIDKLNIQKRVSCTSMLAAFKIAHTAMERREGLSLSIDHNNILRKAARLIGFNVLREDELMRYKQYIPERGWIDTKVDRETFKEFYFGIKNLD